MIAPRTILITGAGSGIGRDAAFALARRGHRVIATTETEAQAEELGRSAVEASVPMTCFKLDVTLEEDRMQVASLELDVLLSNAGIGESGPLSEVPLEILRRTFEVNVVSGFALAQLVLPGMLDRGRGTVLFVSSVAGRLTLPFFGPYSMSKHALSAGVAALRAELHRLSPGVHASLIEPGAYRTGFNQRLASSRYAWLGSGSRFAKLVPWMKKRDRRTFELLEVRSTRGLVQRIVAAAESERPALRYVSPWYVALFVRIARAAGF